MPRSFYTPRNVPFIPGCLFYFSSIQAATMAVPIHHSSSTMQRRPHHVVGSTTTTVSDGSIPVNDSTSKLRKRRKRASATSALFSTHYGSRSEALIQMILLGGLLLILAIYTFVKLPIFLQKEKLYMPATSMRDIGDKSKRYAQLRQEYDDEHPDDELRTRMAVTNLHERTYTPIPNDAYDVHHCPDVPPPNYPHAWNILEILEHWPPDDATPRDKVFQGLCVFDYHRDYQKALAYRNAELPFVIRGDPAVHQTVERWNSPGYMEQLMGDVPHRTEYSPNNHFMYWVPPPKNNNDKIINSKLRKGLNKNAPPRSRVEKPDNWTQPTEMMRMRYADWLRHANVTNDDAQLGPDQPHWYYRLIGCGYMSDGKCDTDSSEYLFDELPWFQPKEALLYVVEPSHQRGIHCRFGMKGVIAENHFDGSRNFIALLGGERRYILSHPDQCEKLALYPLDHPSARHSAIDWSDPDLETFPQFSEARANEVVMQAGDVMCTYTHIHTYIYIHIVLLLCINAHVVSFCIYI